jgi:hypothetical protein
MRRSGGGGGGGVLFFETFHDDNVGVCVFLYDSP